MFVSIVIYMGVMFGYLKIKRFKFVEEVVLFILKVSSYLKNIVFKVDDFIFIFLECVFIYYFRKYDFCI